MSTKAEIGELPVFAWPEEAVMRDTQRTRALVLFFAWAAVAVLAGCGGSADAGREQNRQP